MPITVEQEKQVLELLAECYLLLQEYNQREEISDLRRFGRVWAKLRSLENVFDRAEEIRREASAHPEPPLFCGKCGRGVQNGTEHHRQLDGHPALACPWDGMTLTEPVRPDYRPEPLEAVP